MASFRWIDYPSDTEPDDPGYGPGKIISKVDPDGTYKSISYDKNFKGEDVKITKKIKVHEKKVKKNKALSVRENWPVFGNVDLLMNFQQTEDVFFEIPKKLNRLFQGDDEDFDYLQDPVYLKEKKELKSKLNDYKNEIEMAQDLSKREADKRTSKMNEKPERTTGNSKQEDLTVRVTNLSDFVSEQDIKQLFSMIGEVSRVYLARDKEKNNTKGFAFVTYTNSENAAKAITQLNRHGYDNLLLNVEWAKPSNREK